MKKLICLLLAALLCLPAASCGRQPEPDAEEAYQNITAQEAKALMDARPDCVILDVRTREEYDQGHIPGAVLLPDYEVAERAESVLPDKDRLILVYCRSGRRSKLASEELAALGYTCIREFGGIIDWPYEITTD